MKKRSLVAALAMLMVSAIVLTSSTYAWFATGTTAKVSTINAEINNDSGSIKLSADGGSTYVTSLSYSDFSKASDITATTYAPVSFDPKATTEKFITGTIAQNDTNDATLGGKMIFSPETANGGYTKLNIKLSADVACKVEIDLNIDSTYQFFYGAVKADDKTAIFSSDASSSTRSYYPVIEATAGIDGPNNDPNGIMDSADQLTSGAAYNALGNQVVADNAALVVEFTQPGVKDVVVYVWAEGNDAACTGSITADVSSNLVFTKQANQGA